MVDKLIQACPNTKKGLYGRELFLLRYYGINVFLCVGEIGHNEDEGYVYVYEVETIYHPDLELESLRWDRIEETFSSKGSYDCRIIPDGANNTWDGRALKVKWIEMDGTWKILVNINHETKLYKAASRLNTFTLPVGTFFLEMICDGSGESIDEIMDTGFDTKEQHLEVPMPVKA